MEHKERQVWIREISDINKEIKERRGGSFALLPLLR